MRQSSNTKILDDPAYEISHEILHENDNCDVTHTETMQILENYKKVNPTKISKVVIKGISNKGIGRNNLNAFKAKVG